MTATRLLHCTCQSAFQDETYGRGKRVHNETTGKRGTEWRCTVCGALRSAERTAAVAAIRAKSKMGGKKAGKKGKKGKKSKAAKPSGSSPS